jgi:D-inositol-3-phosphate glycosyltransferase
MKRIAQLMVHTSPLEQAGRGDAGGMNIYVIETAKKLAEQGVAVDIFTRAEKDGLEELVELAPGVEVHHLEAGPVSKLSKEELPAHTGALMSAFLRHQLGKPHNYYDIVHSHYWISGQLGWMISERTGVPLVHNMHTTAKVKNLSLAEGDVREPLIRELGEQQIVDNASALIANTDAEAASLVSLYGAKPSKVHVVAPGVDLNEFNEGVRPNKDKLTVSFVGRIQPHKGPEVLVRAAAEVLALSPQLRSKLDIAIMGDNSGAGHNELEKLKNLAKFLKIEDVVRFVPPVKRSELADWYRASDLVCMPSYSESFGLVALEAQACGTPVVASAVGGLRTAVADGISGVLVDGHDPKAWGSVISRLLLDPKRRELMSFGALQHAKNFSWSATAKQTLDIYEEITNSPKHGFKVI